MLCQQSTDTSAVGSGRKLQRDAKRRQTGSRRPEAERGSTWRRKRPPLSHDDDPIVDRPNGNVLEPELTRNVKDDRKFEARFVASDDRKEDASSGGGAVVERHFRPGRRPFPDAENAVAAEIGDETPRLGPGGERRLVEDSNLTGRPGDGLHRRQKASSVFADADDQVFCPVRGYSDADACGGRERDAVPIEGSR